MTKRISKILIVLIALACACLFFPMQNLKAEAAAIDGVSGNKIILVGLTGSSPDHYFVDNNKVSTLINAQTKDRGNKYFSIVPKGKGDSSGYSEFEPTGDMHPFIEKGLLYATASAQVSTEKDTQITITISAGENSSQISGSGNIATPMLKIDNINDVIKFSFNASSSKEKCNFVIDEPTIHLYTVIESVTLDATNQTVSPGQFVKINAYNDITSMSGASGNFMSFSKINHQIEYVFYDASKKEFAESSAYVEVIGSNLYILPTAPDGTIITLKVCSKKNSFSDEKIYSSNSVTLTVNTGRVNVEVLTDFKNPAKFVGEGSYGVGKGFNLIQTPNKDYTFVGWYVNGEFKGNSRILSLTATLGQQIYAKYIKSISVESVTIASKKYDGTTNIDLEKVSVKFSGLEPGHDVGITGVTYSYNSPNVMKNNTITPNISGLALVGENADIYTLKSQVFPNIIGEIQKRDAYVEPENAQKEYGYADPVIPYTVSNLVEGERVVGEISRQMGEAVDAYSFTLGNLNEKNPNYNFVLVENGAKFVISPRTIYLSNVSVSEKVYDGTTNASMTAQLQNVYNNEDVRVEITANFKDKNASNDKEVKIAKTTLVGSNKNNYILAEYTQTVYGKISPRPITVSAQTCTYTYGDNVLLPYSAELLDGDTLMGELAIDNKNAGDHEIKIGTLYNPNYEITFKSAVCTIKKRPAIITADKQVKQYGDADPEFTYSTTDLVFGDSLTGSMVRDLGEDVNSYTLHQGSLNNPNYEITFVENVLEITKRKIDALIEFLNKTYDGTTEVSYVVNYVNNIKEENFELFVDAELSNINYGTADVVVLSKEIVSGNTGNYLFDFVLLNSQIQISKRRANVFAEVSSKIYGDADPTFSYTAVNLVNDDVLEISISRAEGEDVGKYEFYLNESTADLNPNYEVELAEDYFEILPRELRLSIKTQAKIFGNPNPKIEYSLLDELCNNDKEENILTGEILREEGESVGFYEYILTAVSNSKNYTFINGEDTHFVIYKRPVEVTIFDAVKVYGEQDPTYQYSVSGDIEGERLTVDIVRRMGEDVGTYQLMCATTLDPRYSIEFKEAKLTITPYHLSIKAENKVKIYGELDPKLSLTITAGFLKNNDRLEDIVSGNLIRASGEDVGFYQINKSATLTLGNNYTFDYVPGTLEIIKRNITISAKPTQKVYGEADPKILFEISNGSLAFNDEFKGQLSRLAGENVGSYEINEGTISLNDNYTLKFVANEFTIIKRQIEVVPSAPYKFYGDKDSPLEYEIVGTMISNDKLFGSLYRDKGKTEIEPTGRYKIYSNLFNDNYEIIFGEWYFEIKPRAITIEAESYEIFYGENEPNLNYRIVSGQILNGDTFEGGLKRRGSNNVGIYDIVSTLTLGRNYTIQYIKGTVTIKPVELVIKSTDYFKIYGQQDPNFNYEIVEGKLINNDLLYGSLTREKGENVGSYNIINGIYNSNYNITLQPCKLQILKKDVYMISSIYNKIYDGTTTAYLKNPYISGIIDDVYLSYDKNNCAEFAQSAVGMQIPVRVHDISIVGIGAENYNLILPSNLMANITLNAIENENVCVSAKDPVLFEDCSLTVLAEDVTQNVKIQNHSLVLKYNISLLSGDENLSLDSTYTIKISLPKNISNKNNIYVYQKLSDGNLLLLQSQKLVGGELVVTAQNLGEFYITIEDESWIDYAANISLNLIAVLLIIICVVVVVKYRNKQIQK